MPLQLFPFQPRGATPDWSATPTTSTPVEPVATGSELSQPLCQAANRSLLIATSGYLAAATLLGVVVFLLMKKRLVGSRFVRSITAVALASGAAAALLAYDPLRADDVTRCIHSGEFARYIILGGSTASRALALGVLPAAALTAIACLVANRSY